MDGGGSTLPQQVFRAVALSCGTQSPQFFRPLHLKFLAAWTIAKLLKTKGALTNAARSEQKIMNVNIQVERLSLTAVLVSYFN